MKKFIVIFCVSAMFACVCSAEIKKIFDEEEGFSGAMFQGSDGSAVTITTKDVYAGKKAIKVTPSQSYSESIEGWKFKIAKTPGKGEFRYIMFAWKKKGGTGIMIQFPDNGAWSSITTPFVEPGDPCRRYVAGENPSGWSAIQIKGEVPFKWTLVIRDLYKDFGGFTMTGIAFTPYDGDSGSWDCIYLGTTKEELTKLAEDIKNKK